LLILIYNIIGICFQSNILFDELTVKDHMTFMKMIKQSEEDIDIIIKDFDLLNYKNDIVKILSESQKRKLCIAMAMIGNPKYIFLDEPTTNLDFQSKIFIWNLLNSMKKDKTIIITTDDMQEADYLAERKLILYNGYLNYLGSSEFIKNCINVQYLLKVKSNNTEEVDNIIKKYIPESHYEIENNKTKLISDYEIGIWKLPLLSTSKILEIINELESRHSQNKLIQQFSLYKPSLEELYNNTEGDIKNKINENNEEEEEEDVDYEYHDIFWRRDNGISSYEDSDNLIEINSTPSNNKELPMLINKVKVNTINKFKLIYKFRANCIINNKFYIIYIIAFPMMLIGLFSNLVSFFIHFIDTKEKYGSSISNYYGGDYDYNINMNNSNSSVFSKYFSISSNNNNNVSNYSNTEFNKICQMDEKYNEYFSSISSSVEDNKYSFDIYYNDTISVALPVTINTISNAILLSNNIENKIEVSGETSGKFSEQNYAYLMHANQAISILIGSILFISMASNGFIFVKERINRLIQHYQLIGVSKYIIYIAHSLADMTNIYFFFLLIYNFIISRMIHSDLNGILSLAISYLLM